MNIVGGLYREQCCIPEWDTVLGSGGRAALVLSALSPHTILHTYSENIESNDIIFLKSLGIEIVLNSRATPIVFTYFHPLSRPVIQPPLDEIKLQPPIKVNAEVVLRFGLLEGDAIVTAHRAVFDPQTWRNPPRFDANGSTADELVIVLNKLELEHATGIKDAKNAAAFLIQQQKAMAIVVKMGIQGAMVFEGGGGVSFVPAYRSPRIFKIGTGDVFSSVFAHYWAEKGLSVAESADFASRSVAIYCGTAQLPLTENNFSIQNPIKYITSSSVILEGLIDTVGRRYAMEEARFILRELGVKVLCPALGESDILTAGALLLLADGLDYETDNFQRAKEAGIPIIILRESKSILPSITTNDGNILAIDDFSSALYLAAWAASEHKPQ